MSSPSSPVAAAPSAAPTSTSPQPTTAGGPPANTPAAAPTAATIANSSHPDQAEQALEEPEGLTLRALVSSKEAGVVIGRGGATIAEIRETANVKAGVSKVVPGVPDRVLSIGGTTESVAKAYSLVAQTIVENPVPSSSSAPVDGQQPVASTPTNTSASIRLLISHLLIGSVIGKGGAKIRSIQEISGARMVASKEMLPQSTERIVEVTGSSESVRLAVGEIAKCLIEDWERSQGTVLYHPGAEGLGGGAGAQGQGGAGNGYPATGGQQQQGGGGGFRQNGGGRGGFNQGAGYVPAGGARRSFQGQNGSNDRRAQGGNTGGFPQSQSQQPQNVVGNESDPNWREQKISIPSDMVGCIIGRGGTKINEIRRLSGSRISIAKTAHDESGERMFIISGLPENNEKALFLLYNQLESEKERRVQSVQEEEGAAKQE
ncbi:KH domain-containing protein [Sporobolomyces salmoneus]|uniref:KH domain-containing protein n=1 Tax=Sporobolomyces salmoneus TaxID=183962 RepID=UPI0031714A0B